MLSGLTLGVVIVPLAAGALQAPPARATPPQRAPSVDAPATTAYALVVAHPDGRLGPHLRRAGTAGAGADAAGAAGTHPGQSVVRAGEISADALTLPRLAALLASVLGRDVEDRTGLTGDFAVRLTWTSDPSGPSLFTAVEQELGLRLVPLRSDTQ
jgi:uncharacterized protein (TIGR03435 family)